MNESIPYPDGAERERRIAAILDAGVPAPRRLYSALPALLRAVGFRNLFFGIWDCAFLAVLAAALVWAGCLGAALDSGAGLCLALFVSAPALWAALHWLCIWKERMTGAYELLMTARCTVRQLGVLRMLVSGAAAVAACGAVSGAVRLLAADSPPLLRLLSISCAGLFLYAALDAAGQWYLPASWGWFAPPAVWAAQALGLLAAGKRAAVFFDAVPTAALALAAAGGLGLFMQLSKMTYFNNKEGAVCHAVG